MHTTTAAAAAVRIQKHVKPEIEEETFTLESCSTVNIATLGLPLALITVLDIQ